MISSSVLKSSIISYLRLSNTRTPWEYCSTPGEYTTLYASCFALMLYHYLGVLHRFEAQDLNAWTNYIQNFQDPKSGYFLGPEITKGKLLSKDHSKEHLSEHLTAHVLPALQVLGARPRHPLQFAVKYLSPKFLSDWLSRRDWRRAWIEGNNLLFVGQWIIYLYEIEHLPEAKKSLSTLLSWLDSQVDPRTGVWGTNGYCDNYAGVYGGYHQLLIYYYLHHPVKYPERLIDTVLSLQHVDGGFAQYWGGGSCEDIDAVDILVNLYKRTNYRRNDILTALRRASVAVLHRFTSDGGFISKPGHEFTHMGMELTYAPENKPNMFSTWFGVLTLLLIAEVIKLPCIEGITYNFNRSCSMGWHAKTPQNREAFYSTDFLNVLGTAVIGRSYASARRVKESSPIIGDTYSWLKGHVNRQW